MHRGVKQKERGVYSVCESTGPGGCTMLQWRLGQRQHGREIEIVVGVEYNASTQ